MSTPLAPPDRCKSTLEGLLGCPGPVFCCSEDAGLAERLAVEIANTWTRGPSVRIEGAPTLRSTRLLKLIGAGLGLLSDRDLGAEPIEFDMDVIAAKALDEILRCMNDEFAKTGGSSTPLITLTNVDCLSYDANLERVLLSLVRGVGPWRILLTGTRVPWYLADWLPAQRIVALQGDVQYLQLADSADFDQARSTLESVIGSFRNVGVLGIQSRVNGIENLFERQEFEECLVHTWLLTRHLSGAARPEGQPPPLPADQVLAIATSLEGYSRFKEAQECYELAHALIEQTGSAPDELRDTVRLGLAKCKYVFGSAKATDGQSNLTNAIEEYQKIDDDARQRGNFRLASRARYFRAKIFFYRDWFPEAEDLFQSAKRDLNSQLSDELRDANNAYCDFWLGRIAAREKCFKQAEQFFESAKKGFVRNHLRQGEANLHCEIANCYYELSNYQGGSENFEKALAIDQAIGYGSIVGHELDKTIAELSLYGPTEHAEPFLTQIIHDERATDMNRAKANLWLGKVQTQQARFAEARRHIQAAGAMYEAMEMPRCVAMCCLAMARALAGEAGAAPDDGVDEVQAELGEQFHKLDAILPTLTGNEELCAELDLLKARAAWTLGRSERRDSLRELKAQFAEADTLLDRAEDALQRLHTRVCADYVRSIEERGGSEYACLREALPCLKGEPDFFCADSPMPTCRSTLQCLEIVAAKSQEGRYITRDPEARVYQHLYGRLGIGMSLLHETLAEFLSICRDLWAKREQGVLDSLMPKIINRTEQLKAVCRWFEKHEIFRERGEWPWADTANKPRDLSRDAEVVRASRSVDDVQLIDVVAAVGTLSTESPEGTRELRILDAGCGMGRILPTLIRRFESDEYVRVTYLGIDLSGSVVEQARKTFEMCLAELPGHTRDRFRADFLVGDLRHLVHRLNGEGLRRFDAVILCNVFHELEPRYLPRILTQLCQCTAPGGLLIIHDTEAPYIAERRFVPWEVKEVVEMLEPVQQESSCSIDSHKVLSYVGKELYTVTVSNLDGGRGEVGWRTIGAGCWAVVKGLLTAKCRAIRELALDLESGLRAQLTLGERASTTSKGARPINLTPKSELRDLASAVEKAAHSQTEIVVPRPRWRLASRDILLYEKLRILWWCEEFLDRMNDDHLDELLDGLDPTSSTA